MKHLNENYLIIIEREEMKIIDLSHTINPAMPVYPGTEPPEIKETNTYQVDGFTEKLISMFSHTGTHMDAPVHVLPEGTSLDQFDVGEFAGSCRVVDLEGIATITRADLDSVESYINDLDFLILKSGWSKNWGKPEYFKDYPILTPEAAQFLAESELKGIGIDAISVDRAGHFELPIHRILFAADMVIVENLTNLDQVTGREFLFSCLPLKLEHADGSPVRAVAMFQ